MVTKHSYTIERAAFLPPPAKKKNPNRPTQGSSKYLTSLVQSFNMDVENMFLKNTTKGSPF